MDFLYSISLLVSLLGSGVAVLIGSAPWLRKRTSPFLLRAGFSAIALAALSLIVSVVVHGHWGHGIASSEPLDVARFLGAHRAYAVAALLMATALVSLRWAARRGHGD